MTVTYNDFRNVKTERELDDPINVAIREKRNGTIPASQFSEMTKIGRDVLNAKFNPSYSIQESKQYMNEGFMVIETRCKTSKPISSKFKTRKEAEDFLNSM